ncbi:methyltransferase domain-containing protein [Pseudomonas indica]|uniref:methyltransferase domain-containing protein n=1 Tax=Pseudomonas indica TaxID=137658 RepID=UPI0023F7ED12|nr:methyltransferase domain-containing protein [Pseudomonas indica]MBU3056543.1 methyltransferase domain-containing protein [Pseudomonas indica]
MSVLNVGDGIEVENAAWSFGGSTPSMFDEHVRRSIPDYELAHEIALDLSDFFVRKNSFCYELGSSTGTLTRKLSARHNGYGNWVGIDIEEAMIQQANMQKPTMDNLSFELADITNYPFKPADFIVAFYTIQFIKPQHRQELMNKIYTSLNWGGCFLMFEKVRAPDARFQDITTALYTEFKLRNGYHPSEIISKSKSLKGILEPFSSNGNLDMLRRAGFVDIMTVYKRINFEGFFCIK